MLPVVRGVLDADLTAAFALFQSSFNKDVATVNVQLAKKRLAPIVSLSQAEWEKRRPGG